MLGGRWRCRWRYKWDVQTAADAASAAAAAETQSPLLKLTERLAGAGLNSAVQGGAVVHHCHLFGGGAPADPRPALVRRLSPHQRQFLGCTQFPDEGGGGGRRPRLGLQPRPAPQSASNVARLHHQHHCPHQVPSSLQLAIQLSDSFEETLCLHLDEGCGRVESGHHELARHAVHVRLDLAGDVELVAVKRHPAQVGQQVRPGRQIK